MEEEIGTLATKKIGKRKRVSAKNSANSNNVELPGHVKQLKNEKAGRKGLQAKLMKYAQAPSINVLSSETNNYFSKILPSLPQIQLFEDMVHRESQSVNIPDEVFTRDPIPKIVSEFITKDPQLKGPMYQSVWLSLERNLLFYGYGSKIGVINDLVDSYLKGEDVLSINGANGVPAVRALLNTITNSILMVDDCSALGMIANTKYICDNLDRHYGRTRNDVGGEGNAKRSRQSSSVQRGQYSHSKARLHVIIHDISALPHREAQWALSILAACSSVCLIACLEHLNTSLLWDAEMLVRFNWAFRHVPTFVHHQIGSDFALNVSSNKINEESGTAWLSVLTGLSHKHIELFEVLCLHVLPLSDKRMLRSDMMDQLKAKMTVKNPEELRRLLKEFLDHKIIQEVTFANRDYLSLQLNEKDIRHFLQKKDEKYFR